MGASSGQYTLLPSLRFSFGIGLVLHHCCRLFFLIFSPRDFNGGNHPECNDGGEKCDWANLRIVLNSSWAGFVS